jgi:hypothetical protein
LTLLRTEATKPMSIKNMMEVISPARIEIPRVHKEATLETPEDPRLTIPRDTINARKVRPQAKVINH